MNNQSPIAFISLFDAVNKVALRMQVSDAEVDNFRDIFSAVTSYETMVKRWEIRREFQQSRAAHILVRCLANGSGPKPLRWFDVAELGDPLCRDKVREEGMDELIFMARWEREYKEQYQRRRSFSNWRPGPQGAPKATAPILDPIKMPRIHQIGFDRAELIAFFDTNNIPHSLIDPSSPLDNEAEPAADQSAPVGKATPRSKHSRAHADLKCPNFRGPLAPVLKLAWTGAVDKTDHVMVFAALKAIALAEKPPHPLVGYEPDIKAVKYLEWDDESNDEVARFFKKSDMRSRMRNSKKAEDIT